MPPPLPAPPPPSILRGMIHFLPTALATTAVLWALARGAARLQKVRVHERETGRDSRTDRR